MAQAYLMFAKRKENLRRPFLRTGVVKPRFFQSFGTGIIAEFLAEKMLHKGAAL